MSTQDPLQLFNALLEATPTGLLTTIGADGYPHARWMVATTINREHGYLYAVAIEKSRKIHDLEGEDRVAWSFQDPGLTRIAYIQGRAAVMDNPRLKAEVLERLGPRLANFWRINPDPGHLVVIETAIERVSLYYPMENRHLEKETGA